MHRLVTLLAAVFTLWVVPAMATDVVDATGRTVTVPDHVLRVLPAGPPAAVLLAAIAPDLMLGWPHAPEGAAAAMLPPSLADLPEVPAVTGTDVEQKLAALHPDLILDYGTTDQRYAELARSTQEKTGIPTILLDGRLAYTPLVFRLMGKVLHREARGEELARIAEGILASVRPSRAGLRVAYVRGPDGAQVTVPGGNNSEAMEFLGWTLVAPAARPGEPARASFRAISVADLAALDPDMILFSDEAMRAKVAASPEWRALRAVRENHAWIVPGTPFGWMESPPSVNRLLGLAWLANGVPHPGVVPLAAVFGATVYGRTPTPAQIETLRASLTPLPP